MSLDRFERLICEQEGVRTSEQIRMDEIIKLAIRSYLDRDYEFIDINRVYEEVYGETAPFSTSVQEIRQQLTSGKLR